jgi:hypothetical protein
MQFVPSEQKAQKTPCRHIPLSEQGVTLDSMYRTETPDEVESTVAQWLRSTIQTLEREQAQRQSPSSENKEIANKKTANG